MRIIISRNSRRDGFMDHELGSTPEGGNEAVGELNTDGALQELAQAVEALHADFRRSMQGYDHQRMLMDRLHSENEQLRRAELERSQDPMIRDLISLADTCLRNGRTWLQREAVAPSDIDRVLREVADEVGLILERQGVEAFQPKEGTKFDRREARVVRSATTSDASRDGTVAEVLKPGYRIGHRILRYCDVVVWTFVTAPLADATGAAETEPDDSCITSVCWQSYQPVTTVAPGNR
jgi:molecular chaperone GrpE (heat shock protein)